MANKALRAVSIYIVTIVTVVQRVFYLQAVKNHQNVNSDHRVGSQKVLDNVTMVTTAAVMDQGDKKQNFVTITTTSPLSHVAVVTTASNVTMVTTVAPSTSVTMTTASNKKAALQLVSQLEQNLLIKQAASSAAQEVISGDVLTESSTVSHESSVARVSRSVSPTPLKKVIFRLFCELSAHC